MPLSTHVTDRFGTNSDFLRPLTNHDDPSAGTVNTVRLGKAADAAEGQFVVYAQVAYDDADAAHIEAGVKGVLAYLRMWGSKQGAADGSMKAFQEDLKAIGSVSSRKRVTPTTKSVYTKSMPDTSLGDVRPPFDTEQFDEISPAPPDGDGGTI